MNGYNRLAPYYRFLSFSVFGNSLRHAQKPMISYINPNHQILILGGGDGWILNYLDLNIDFPLEITFVDFSDKMIQIAQKKQPFNHLKVNWHCVDYSKFETETTFDLIYTPFFLDNFYEDKIDEFLMKFHKNLENNGLWLNVDFEINSIFSKVLIKSMYLFFNSIKATKTNKIYENKHLKQLKYFKLDENATQSFFFKSIQFKKYSKNNDFEVIIS